MKLGWDTDADPATLWIAVEGTDAQLQSFVTTRAATIDQPQAQQQDDGAEEDAEEAQPQQQAQQQAQQQNAQQADAGEEDDEGCDEVNG